MTREHFKRKSLHHYESIQKVRAIKQLFRVSQVTKLDRMKISLANKIHMRKVFDMWRYSLQKLHDDKIGYLRST
jgi:hypothetical protein